MKGFIGNQVRGSAKLNAGGFGGGGENNKGLGGNIDGVNGKGKDAGGAGVLVVGGLKGNCGKGGN